MQVSQRLLSWVPRVLAGLPDLEPVNGVAVAAGSVFAKAAVGATVAAWAGKEGRGAVAEARVNV